jgi:hypothetical protein
MKSVWWVALLPCFALLTACENNAASYVIDNSTNHSISFVREQNVAWVGAVQQHFVVSRFPDCQRRYPIDSSSTTMEKMDLYEVKPMLYAARQGNTWYALSTEECRVQKFTAPPEVIPPGRLVGSFVKQNGQLTFKAPASAPN